MIIKNRNKKLWATLHATEVKNNNNNNNNKDTNYERCCVAQSLMTRTKDMIFQKCSKFLYIHYNKSCSQEPCTSFCLDCFPISYELALDKKYLRMLVCVNIS